MTFKKAIDGWREVAESNMDLQEILHERKNEEIVDLVQDWQEDFNCLRRMKMKSVFIEQNEQVKPDNYFKSWEK